MSSESNSRSVSCFSKEHLNFDSVLAGHHAFIMLKLQMIKHFMQVLPEGMLMKSLSRPGPGKSRCCIVDSWACFRFLEMFHVSSNWRGAGRLLNSVWVRSY